MQELVRAIETGTFIELDLSDVAVKFFELVTIYCSGRICKSPGFAGP